MIKILIWWLVVVTVLFFIIFVMSSLDPKDDLIPFVCLVLIYWSWFIFVPLLFFSIVNRLFREAARVWHEENSR